MLIMCRGHAVPESERLLGYFSFLPGFPYVFLEIEIIGILLIV
jgi:hypothetical protein